MSAAWGSLEPHFVSTTQTCPGHLGQGPPYLGRSPASRHPPCSLVPQSGGGRPGHCRLRQSCGGSGCGRIVSVPFATYQAVAAAPPSCLYALSSSPQVWRDRAPRAKPPTPPPGPDSATPDATYGCLLAQPTCVAASSSYSRLQSLRAHKPRPATRALAAVAPPLSPTRRTPPSSCAWPSTSVARALALPVMPTPWSAPCQTALSANASYARAAGHIQTSTMDDVPAPTGRTPVARSFSPQGEPPSNRRCVFGLSDPTPPPRGSINHLLTVTGDFEWCGRCGRTTTTSREGRLQQWRRKCVPLPDFQRKLAKGHNLAFHGQWHCTECPCPSHRLTVKRCRGPSSLLRSGPPILIPAPGNEPPPGPPVPTHTAVKRQLSLRDFFRSLPTGQRPRLGSPNRQGVG